MRTADVDQDTRYRLGAGATCRDPAFVQEATATAEKRAAMRRFDLPEIEAAG
jgi:hypothetical protein